MNKCVVFAFAAVVSFQSFSGSLTNKATGEKVDIPDGLLEKAFGVADLSKDAHLFETNFFGVSLGGNFRGIESAKPIAFCSYSFTPDIKMGLMDFEFRVAPMSGKIHTIIGKKKFSVKSMAELQYVTLLNDVAKKYNREVPQEELNNAIATGCELKFITAKMFLSVIKQDDGFYVALIAFSEALQEEAKSEAEDMPRELFGVTLGSVIETKGLKKADRPNVYCLSPSNQELKFENVTCLVTPKTKRVAQIKAISRGKLSDAAILYK